VLPPELLPGAAAPPAERPSCKVQVRGMGSNSSKESSQRASWMPPC